MELTTTTKLARNWKKEFDSGMKIVMCNNEDIGMIRWKDYYQFFKNSNILEELKQEMREAKDTTTSQMIEQYNKWKTTTTNSISFDDFKNKYNV